MWCSVVLGLSCMERWLILTHMYSNVYEIHIHIHTILASLIIDDRYVFYFEYKSEFGINVIIVELEKISLDEILLFYSDP